MGDQPMAEPPGGSPLEVTKGEDFQLVDEVPRVELEEKGSAKEMGGEQVLDEHMACTVEEESDSSYRESEEGDPNEEDSLPLDCEIDGEQELSMLRDEQKEAEEMEKSCQGTDPSKWPAACRKENRRNLRWEHHEKKKAVALHPYKLPGMNKDNPLSKCMKKTRRESRMKGGFSKNNEALIMEEEGLDGKVDSHGITHGKSYLKKVSPHMEGKSLMEELNKEGLDLLTTGAATQVSPCAIPAQPTHAGPYVSTAHPTTEAQHDACKAAAHPPPQDLSPAQPLASSTGQHTAPPKPHGLPQYSPL